MLLLLAGTLAE